MHFCEREKNNRRAFLCDDSNFSLAQIEIYAIAKTNVRTQCRIKTVLREHFEIIMTIPKKKNQSNATNVSDR